MKLKSIRTFNKKDLFLVVSILFFSSVLIQRVSKRIQIRNGGVNKTASTAYKPNLKERLRKTSLGARVVPIRKAIKMKFGPVYIFGAVAGNTSDRTTWDVIKVYASINTTFYKNKDVKLTCCLMYKFQNATDIVQRPVLAKWKHWARATLTTFHFTCPNVHHRFETIPSKVGLSLDGSSCGEAKVAYIDTFVPYKETGTKLALGTQVAYGNLSAELIIEWMETYKYLGVDKVISYYHRSVNSKALKVLQYYHKSGFVDLYRYIPAGEEKVPRKFSLKNSGQLYNDLSMVVKESFEIMSGYKYFGIIDFDEYLMPSKNRNLKEMLSHLYKTYKNAAGFVFKTQYFYTSWGKSGTINDLILGQYVNHTDTPPTFDRQKQIYMPKYISHGTVQTHQFKPVAGFKRVEVPPSKGFIRHFRKCRSGSRSSESSCMSKVGRIMDTSLARWSMRILDNVHLVRKKVFGSKKLKY